MLASLFLRPVLCMTARLQRGMMLGKCQFDGHVQKRASRATTLKLHFMDDDKLHFMPLVAGNQTTGDFVNVDCTFKNTVTPSTGQVIDALLGHNSVAPHLSHLHESDRRPLHQVSVLRKNYGRCTRHFSSAVPPPLPPLNITNRTPIVWLDANGVINIETPYHCNRREDIYYDGSESDARAAFPDCQKIDLEGLYPSTVRFSPSVVRRINRWATVAEVRWMTAWESLDGSGADKATKYFAPGIGMHAFPANSYLKFDLEKAARDNIDFNHVIPVEDMSRPIVWVDDWLGIGRLKQARTKLEEAKRNRNDAGGLLCVDPSAGFPTHRKVKGLTHADIDRIDTFLGLPPVAT